MSEPCKVCNYSVSRQVFKGEHIQGEMVLWMCSGQVFKNGNGCGNEIAYFSEADWNAAQLDSNAAYRQAFDEPEFYTDKEMEGRW